FQYAGPYRTKTVMSGAVILLAVVFQVLPFLFVYRMITPLITGGVVEISHIAVCVAGVGICLVLNALLYVKGLSMSHEAAYNILMRLRVSLQGRMENLPLGKIQEKGTGSLKRMFVDDVDSIEMLLAHALPEGLGNTAIPVLVYASLFLIDWKLALLSLASLPVGLAAMCMMYSIGRRDMADYYKAGKIMNNTIIEYINGMEVVKVFNKDSDSYRRYRSDITAYRDFTIGWYRACWPWMALYNSILPCVSILTLPLGSWFVLRGYSQLPDLILVMCLSLSIGLPLLKALSFVPSLPQINYKIETLENIMSEEPLQQRPEGFCGDDMTIRFNDVAFAYDDKVAVDKINMTVEEGSRVALVGESGSGKSTLAKLLVHYYDVDRGTITVGGQDIRDMSLAALNDRIAYVAQEQYLFNTSILENIRLGRPSASREEIMDAAQRARCMEFIGKLPEGIDTVVGGGGRQLSGGQRQRVAIARAILKDAPVVVLDEAMAFTDPENEEKLEQAISEVVRGKTLMIIAHKLPSVMNADVIYMMERGHIVGSGTHQQLLESCPQYQRLWQASVAGAEWRPDVERGGEAR
ncbi:MAG: ABC transporter ATP-binding protein, partial [Anaerovoracaceae bacterium]